MVAGKPICIITEANETVATGHLSEACALATALLDAGRGVIFYINSDFPRKIAIPCEFITYDDVDSIAPKLRDTGCSVAVTDLRLVGEETVKNLKRAVPKFVCIDELGKRQLDCDVIINPLIDEGYHDYPDSSAELLTGPGYMIMKPGFVHLNSFCKKIRPKIETVTICMGGMDTLGATIRILIAIRDLPISINVIAGGGFRYIDELRVMAGGNVTVLENVSNIYDVFFESDIAFCSGGNVLYELACVGTPALTVYTNPHERSSAAAFENLGFGRCLGQAGEISERDILAGLEFYKSRDVRSAASRRGKSIVDGKALERIMALLERYI